MTANGVRRTAFRRRPAVIRRSAMVVGEVRIYQELIRLAVERNRLVAEGKMWGHRDEEVSQKLTAADRYTEELQNRLGLSRQVSSGSRLEQRKAGGEVERPGGGSRGPMQFRYCPER